jgi:hypothetical protein
MKPVAISLVVLLCSLAVYLHAQESGEGAIIQCLLSAVEASEGARFIRNGHAYDAKAAADHLRLKLRLAGTRVKTADDFIRLCGSKSSVSGEAYRIQFSDGTTVDAEVFFRRTLAELANGGQIRGAKARSR